MRRLLSKRVSERTYDRSRTSSRASPGSEWQENRCRQSQSSRGDRSNLKSDCASRGKVVRRLTLVDDCTRECPVIEVDTSLGGLRVRRVLDRMVSERGLPEAIVVDNRPEFRGRALVARSEQRGVRLEFIQPGKPAQNAYIETFNGRPCLANVRSN